MSSSQRSGDRHIYQDYIARIRYSNALPPPPNPPKLLDMPSTELFDSQYTTTAFASRLAREQPLNIETDAEMGMAIDLVGIPGVFDGEEKAILASDQIPTPNSRDIPLLRPLHSLGKPIVQEGSVSFLRRTEYTAAVISKKAINPLIPSAKRTNSRKRPSPEIDQDSPSYIKRKIDEGFAASRKFGDGHIKHPSRRQAKLLVSMPLLPDLNCFPDSGAYVTMKFTNNPVPKSSTYDERMTAGLFRPIAQTEEEEAEYYAAYQSWETSGQRGFQPTIRTTYDFYLAEGPGATSNFHKKLDLSISEQEDKSLYTNRNSLEDGVFSFRRVRAYETIKETELDHSSKYSEELLLSLEPKKKGKGTTAYYLPVMARTTIQAQRSKNIAYTTGMSQDRDVIDQLDIRVEEPPAQLLETINKFKVNPEHVHLDTQIEDGLLNLETVDDQQNLDKETDYLHGPNATQITPRDFEDEDAEGENEG